MSKKHIVERFQVRDNVVFDAKTNLEWQKGHSGRMNWNAALAYAKGLGGDWRLPTVKELVSLIDWSKKGPASDFPGMNSDMYWSSSSYAGGSSLAWSVFFNDGFVYYDGKLFPYYVRCVRGPVSKDGE